jgi:TPR repeat protein
MTAIWIDRGTSPGTAAPADAFVACSLSAAQAGDAGAYFELGVALSTGSQGLACDYVEAHKWFNIAATAGHQESALCRADLSREMNQREIAEAQRRARQWLAAIPRKAA